MEGIKFIIECKIIVINIYSFVSFVCWGEAIFWGLENIICRELVVDRFYICWGFWKIRYEDKGIFVCFRVGIKLL